MVTYPSCTRLPDNPALFLVNDPIEGSLRSRFGGKYRKTPEQWLFDNEGADRVLDPGEDSEYVLAVYAYHQEYLYTDHPNLYGAMNKMQLMLAARFYQRMNADEQTTIRFLAALRATDSRWHPLDDCLSVRNQTLDNVEWLLDPSAIAPKVVP